MDPFKPYTIRCVTCNSQLRVERADVIGKILSCPKCQSMVQIAPPEKRTDDETSTIGQPRAADDASKIKTNAPSIRDKSDAKESILLPERVPTVPSIKVPQWILLPVAAAVGVVLAIGLWTATRPKSETIKVIEKENNKELLSDSAESNLTAEDRQDAAAESTVAVGEKSTAVQMSPDTTQEVPSSKPEATPPAVSPDASTSTDPSQDQSEETDNALRTRTKPDEEQATTNTLKNQEDNESIPRLSLPPATAALDKKLQTKLQGLQLKHASLQNTLTLASQLSAISIFLDQAATLRSGLTSKTSINYEGKNKPIGEALSEILLPLGLIHIPSGDTLFITVPDKADNTLHSEIYNFDTKQIADDMARIIPMVVAPKSWKAAGGNALISQENNQLHVRQTKSNHSLTRQLLLQIRSIQNQMENTNKQHAAIDSSDEPLTEVIEYGTRQPMLLNGYLRQLASRISRNIILDELELLRRGIPTQQMIEIDQNKYELQDLFDRTLKPIGLTSLIIDHNTIIITARESAFDSRMIIRVYAMPPLNEMKTEQLVDSIRKIAPETWTPGKGEGQLIVENNTNTLIVLQKPWVQREVAKYLKSLSND